MSTGSKPAALLSAQVQYLRARLSELEQTLAAAGPEYAQDGSGPAVGETTVSVALDVEARLPEILSGAAFPVAIMDRDARFLFVNRSAAAILQRSPVELTGYLLRDACPTPLINDFETRIRRVADTGSTLTSEEEIEFPDGSRWLSSVVSPVPLLRSQSVGVLIVAIDITDRKSAEAALVERIRFEELIAEISSDFVSATESEIEATTDRTLRKIGEFIAVDRVLLFGMSPDQSVLSCQNEWAAAGIAPAITRLQNQPRIKNPWLFPRLSAGELLVVPRVRDLPEAASTERNELLRHGVQSLVWVPIQFGGRVVGALCLDSLRAERNWSQQLVARLQLVGNIMANSRERIRAERALAKSREFAEGITAASPHICFVLDLDHRRSIYVNPQIYDQLGYSAEEVLAMGDQFVPLLLHPDEVSHSFGIVKRWRSAGNDAVIENKYRMRRRDGQWRWFRAWVKVFHRASDGHVDQVIGWVEDFTDRQHAEEDLQRHRGELARVDRVNTLGEMVTGIAHELSQPLYALTNFVNAAKNVIDQHSHPDLLEAAAWLRQASTAAGNAGEIIQRLRSFARSHPQQRREECVATLVEEAIALMQFEMQRRETRVVLQFHGETAKLLVDRVQIQQVLVNLIQNACEAMESRSPAERTVTVEVFCGIREVEFRVRDHGVGLPASGISIFEPFVTTKPQGLGLGLAISKTIIEEHGGQLWADCNPGAGSTFHVIIPVARGSES